MVSLHRNPMGIAMRFHLPIPKMTSIASVLILATALAACSPRIHTRGNLPDPDRVAELKPGDITREEVVELIGSPSTTASFDNEAWLYISERTETTAWFEPEVKERNVLLLEFDKDGVLTDKLHVGLDASNKLIPVDRRTPTYGSKLTIIEQMVGNFRRFTGNE